MAPGSGDGFSWFLFAKVMEINIVAFKPASGRSDKGKFEVYYAHQLYHFVS